MRINEIRVDSYGELTNCRFDFSAGNFHLIYGPNEAGKSTFLELVRDLLFGFSQQGQYQFSLLGRPFLSASLAFALDNRQSGFLTRKLDLQSPKRDSDFSAVLHKEENDSFHIDETEYKSYLGNASRQLFCHFFGFSYQELAEGELLLRSSGLSDLIYGTGLGGLALFQSLKNNLKKENDRFFKKSGNAKVPKINNIVLELNDLTQKIKTESIDFNEYNNVRLQKADTEHKYLDIKQKLVESRKEREHWEQFETAYQLYEAFQHCRNEYAIFIESIPFSEEQLSLFPIGGMTEMNQIQQSIQENQDELLFMINEEKNNQIKIVNIERFPNIIENAKQIQRLDKRLEEIQNIRLNLPTLKAKFELDQKIFYSRMEKSGILMTEEELEHFLIQPQKKTRIRQLFEEEKNNLEAEKKLNHYIQNKKEERVKIKLQIDLLVQNKQFNINGEKIDFVQKNLNDILQKESYYSPLFKQLQNMESQKTKIVKENEQLLLSIQSCLVNHSDQIFSEDQIVPLDSQIQQYEDVFYSLNRESENNLSEIKDLEKKNRHLNRRLHEIDPEGKLPSFHLCDEKRRQRDKIWSQLKKSIELKQNEPELIQEYESIIQQLDELTEIRVNKAKEIAEIQILLIEKESNQKELSILTEKTVQIQKNRDELQSAWKKLWLAVHLDINDSDVSVMKEWLLLFQQWRNNNNELSKLQREWDSILGEIVDYEAICQKIIRLFEKEEISLVTNSDLSQHKKNLTFNLTKIRLYYDQLKNYQLENQRLLLRFQEIESELLSFQSELSEIDKQKKSWVLQFQNLLNDLNLPQEWTSQTFNETVLEIYQLQKEQEYLRENRLSIESQTTKISLFENDVWNLTNQLDWDQSQYLSAEDIVLKLVSILEIAKNNENRYFSLFEKQKELQESIQLKKTLVKTKEERCQQLFQLLNVSTLREFIELGQNVEKYSDLKNVFQNSQLRLDSVLKSTIQKTNEKANLDDYHSIFKDINPADIALNCQQSIQKEAELDETLKNLLTELGELSQKLKTYEKMQGAARFLVNKENLLNELKLAVHQYIPRLFAFNLLESSQKKFENEREPQILNDASVILSKLTSGRYIKIVRSQIGDSFEVCQKDNYYKKPNQLSSGTKEQLYLAIRLAHIQNYCQHSESLPLVIDDILINFDKNRSEATLKVLSEIASEGRQIIYLTCHQAMKNMFEKFYHSKQITEMQERNLA